MKNLTIDFIINEKKNFKDNTLITGFHGIGTTGFITIKYIINQIEAERVGTIISNQLPPFITTKDGKISRIVPILKTGAGVVTSRGDVHYVVTEYGVANLFGKSIQERAKALINISHPKFRDELTQFAKSTYHI